MNIEKKSVACTICMIATRSFETNKYTLSKIKCTSSLLVL